MHFVKGLLLGVSAATLLVACSASGDDQGVEYAPNMYHSVAYEPYTQIKDWDAGRWLTSIDYPVPQGKEEGHAEFYNSNIYNPSHMNMREPAPHTVSRNPQGWLPYSIPNDSSGLRLANSLVNPLPASEEIVSQGKVLYETYCDHCHGAKGAGDGKVGSGVTIDGVEKKAYAGVPNYNSDALKNITEGHIFHVITYGKGLMKPHDSQVNPEERWKIARYVKTLQK
ncbi:MAG TPA: cytochrome c [Ohtaekwangia sp.]|nr:cytochrome c [Ohtaekwangia sp.]